ncbi:MAG: hypothetical protein JNK81_01010 [Anaerolineales bacterium]|nr:hypothetical protein [Anaerolineales bacterium]
MNTPNPEEKKNERRRIIRSEFVLPLIVGILVTVIGGYLLRFITPINQLTSTSLPQSTSINDFSTNPIEEFSPSSTATNIPIPIFTSTDLPTYTPTFTPTPSTILIFENGEFRQSTATNFNVRVAKIELRPNNKMRWYFEFWNQNDKEILFGLDQSKIVLADEFGNQYDVLDGTTFPNKVFEKTIAAGVKYEHWLDFNAPINNAKSFFVTLVSSNYYWHPNYGVFEININYDSANTPPIPIYTVSTDSSIIFENGEFINTSFQNFIFRIARIDLRSNNRMRWYFEFWNKSDKASLFGLDHSLITLSDENGHQYTVLDSSSYPNKKFEWNIPAGVMVKIWIEFDAPLNNSKTFKVTLVPANYYWHPRYAVFTLNLP